MATAFVSWSVNDVKRWIYSWNTEYSVSQSTITNLQKAADLNHIDGQTMIYFNRDDLKQIGLKQKDIDIAIKRIDDLVVGAYLDYVLNINYGKNTLPSRQHRKRTNSSAKHEWKKNAATEAVAEDPYVMITVKKILKQGWIEKKGEWNKHRKRRYFVLNNHKEIKYYQDENKTMYAGSIDLKEVSGIKLGLTIDGKYGFELITDQRIWHLCTDDKNERKSWCFLIDREMNAKKRKKGGEMNVNTHNEEALNAIASNKNVHSAVNSAMNDQNIQKAALNAYMNEGNDQQSNQRLMSVVIQNKEVQKAAISVAKDEKVQKATYRTAKKHATKKNAKKAKRFLKFKGFK